MFQKISQDFLGTSPSEERAWSRDAAGVMWWGPTLLNIVIGGLLFALSRPIGTWMGSGLED